MTIIDETSGPVDCVLIRFPGNKFRGEIAPALADLVNDGIIHIIDLVFILKDENGDVTAAELTDLGDDAATFDDVEGDVGELLSEDDIQDAAEALEPNTSALLVVFENSWAARLATAMRNADGEVLAYERIPHDVVMAAVGAAEEIAASA
jgi:uncharacterized membrane protein